MKFLLFALFAATVFGASLPIEKHNQAYLNGEVHWQAGENRIKAEDLKTLCGTQPSQGRPRPPMRQMNVDVSAIPESFDSRTAWPKCTDLIGHIYDQGHCGSCWAMGAFETLEDRLCIQSEGAVKIQLAAQDLVSCDSSSMGCNGGWPSAAWSTMQRTGIVTEACYPYAMGACKHPGCSDWPTPACNSTCANGAVFKQDKHHAASSYSVPSNVEAIQTEIMTHGPVEAAFTVYEDFANYKSGVYHHVSGSAAGGHAIKIIGWGVDGTTPYWMVANSWNTDWGMNGLFYILRGKNECGIEDEVVAGLAKL
ncbi:putative Cathepsin B [Paratrimastix pyriformis]|uniref:Cathepsin B n=1 Tax=Paratrimastix pyriformis TaxID=342808 RepID=A0ABQ8UJB0_9EUKA|nr:putative Cathepsin B [Paratrimastix pyriformis]|eukprot:GAFH01002533.1.p2 GENE.GAFH01002533.1~~GAFH01002533.1.p2  ORF type:complete len:309 (-),score=93.46 GAFH01002533.1:217-1143(-)